jgi:O-antigen/teichoic acid export membrane protein
MGVMRMVRNVATLFLWQGSVYLIPLILTPYLSRVLGVESFGLFGIASSISGYVILIADWGFAWSATRDVARCRLDPVELRRIFWDVLMARVLLGFASLAFLNLALAFLPLSHELTWIVVAFELQVIAIIFSVDWFLRGLERMGWFAVASLFGRILVIPFTFMFVHTAGDAAIAAAVQGVGAVISTVLSLIIIAHTTEVMPIDLSINGALQQIRKASTLFLSTAGISFYTQGNIFILGVVSNSFEAGLFTGADRIRRGVQGLTGPISGAVYPRISRLVANQSSSVRKFLVILLIGQGSFTLLLSIALYYFAPWIVAQFLGIKFLSAVTVVRWLSPIPFLVGLSNVFGTNMMLPLGLNREFMTITLASGILNVVLISVLSWQFGAAGAAASASFTEAAVTTAMFIVILKNMHFLPKS